MISENLKEIQNKIQETVGKIKGRTVDDVLLLAVSKTQPEERMKEAIDSGIYYFGENKVQELTKKYALFSEEVPEAEAEAEADESQKNKIHWHFIGHLQTNKVKQVVGKVDLIHSVDSFKLASEIERQSKQKEITTPILIEVNMARELSKFGVLPENVEPLVREISLMKHIEVKGLMTVAPMVENPEDNRIYFQAMRQLLMALNEKQIEGIAMSELSMGMSNDYLVAIEEGATIVRVGTGVFGVRT
ncbi:MAG: YggS family pyridoxal phosphate-dependent enzyme [Bacillota bacterium]